MPDPIRILLIDNDADVSNVVTSFLQKRGFAVTQALSGEEGLASLETLGGAGPDLVILDLRMPGIGGLEVLARLEERAGSPPVLVLSGFVDDQDRARLEASALVHTIVKKPFDLFGLEDIAKEAVRLREDAETDTNRPSADGSTARTGELPWAHSPE